MEEGRNAGKTLKQIADEQKLRFIEVDAVDESNKTPDGKTGIDYADAGDILKEAFTTCPGISHDAVELPSDSFGWFDVMSVTEKKQKDFDTVKGEVKALYMDTERSRRLERDGAEARRPAEGRRGRSPKLPPMPAGSRR